VIDYELNAHFVNKEFRQTYSPAVLSLSSKLKTFIAELKTARQSQDDPFRNRLVGTKKALDTPYSRPDSPVYKKATFKEECL
jgi:hypothetical protein